MPFDHGLPQETLRDRVRFYPLFACLKHDLASNEDEYAVKVIDEMSNSEFLDAISAAIEEMEEKKPT